MYEEDDVTRFLIEHEEGCTPLNPCVSCTCAAFLRAKLDPKDFEKLLAMIHVDSGSDKLSLETSVRELDLSGRIQNTLLNAGACTLADVIRMSPNELIRLPNFGRKSLNELEEYLAEHGYKLGTPPLSD